MAGYPWISGQVLTAADLDAAFTNLPTVSSVTATGSTTARTLAARAADVANVLDYGAGIGGDDAAAIRAALATGKKVVFIPPGSYVMKSRPNQPGPFNFVPPPCVLFNANQNVQVIAYGATFSFDPSICVPNTNYSNAGPSYLGFIGDCKNVTWSGGTFNQPDFTNLGASVPNSIWFQNVTRIVIEDVEFAGAWKTGSNFAGVWMFDCVLRRNVGYGGGIAFDFAYCENLEVFGNVFDGGVGAGNTASVGFKIFSDPNTATFNTAGLTLAVVTNSDGTTRQLRNGQSNSIRLHNNVLSGWHSNIYLDGEAGVDIAANTITTSAGAFPTSNGVIIDTTAQTNTAGYTTHDVTVRDNEIFGNGGPAIGINTETYGLGGVRITDNRIYDNTCPNAVYFYNNSPLGTIVVENNDFSSRASLSIQGPAVSTGNATAILAAGGVYQNNIGVTPYNQFPVVTVTGTSTLGATPFGTGTTPALIARQIANAADTLLFQRFTDTTPTGSLLRYVNAANSQNLALISIAGNATFAGGMDGTAIGATTASTGKFTTLTLTSALTLSAPVTVTGTTYTVLGTDCTIILNPSAGQTLTLGTATAGRVLHLKLIAAFAVISASSNVVPLAGGAAGTAILAATAGKWCTLQGDGTNWQILQAN